MKELPSWFKEAISEISKKLAEERRLAFYGDERTFIPPSQLYSEEAPSKH